jgi:hypothetical protein
MLIRKRRKVKIKLTAKGREEKKGKQGELHVNGPFGKVFSGGPGGRFFQKEPPWPPGAKKNKKKS